LGTQKSRAPAERRGLKQITLYCPNAVAASLRQYYLDQVPYRVAPFLVPLSLSAPLAAI